MRIPGPTLPAQKVLTPFGYITLGELKPLEITQPQFNPQRMKAFRHAAAADLTAIFGIIPYIGGVIGGQLSNLHTYAMKDELTNAEYEAFIESNKSIPSNGLALLHSFGEKKGRK